MCSQILGNRDSTLVHKNDKEAIMLVGSLFPIAPSQHFQRVAEWYLQGVWIMSRGWLGVCCGSLGDCECLVKAFVKVVTSSCIFPLRYFPTSFIPDSF